MTAEIRAAIEAESPRDYARGWAERLIDRSYRLDPVEDTAVEVFASLRMFADQFLRAVADLDRLQAERDTLADALRACVKTAAECRRWLVTGTAQRPNYVRYRETWDNSFAAEAAALSALAAIDREGAD